jgi:hypothetical protein
VPLAHPPGHAQVDFGEAIAVIGGVRQKIHFFCIDLPQSDACSRLNYLRASAPASDPAEYPLILLPPLPAPIPI